MWCTLHARTRETIFVEVPVLYEKIKETRPDYGWKILNRGFLNVIGIAVFGG